MSAGDCNRSGAPINVIVLNGGSSSGKSSIARCLQELLDQPWVTLALDDLLDALPPSLVGEAPPREGGAPLVRYGADGTVFVDAAWEPVESAWDTGVASMARAGLGVIIDEVLLDGGPSQRRLAVLLDGLEVLWVGVHCDPAVAATREASRADRAAGMAASQASTVHAGVRYDVTVDTTTASIEECARAVLSFVQRRG
jgi:chloramphenicol 3-O phosphotransferase